MNKILIIIFIILFSNLYSQDTKFEYMYKDSSNVDSASIINLQLYGKIKKLIRDNKPNSNQCIIIFYDRFKNIQKDTVCFEIWLNDDYHNVFNLYNDTQNLVYFYIDSTLILIPNYSKDTNNIFFKKTGFSRKFYYDRRKYIKMQAGGNKNFAVYAFFVNKKGNLKCRNGKKLFRNYYKEYNSLQIFFIKRLLNKQGKE